MNKKERKFYEKFKKSKITLNDLMKAKELSGHLGNLSGKFKVLLRMLSSNIKGEFSISAMDKLKIIAAIVYVINPFEAIPDIIPLFGFGDDIAVVGYVLTKISEIVSDYEQFELMEKIKKKDKEINIDELEVVNED